MIVRLRAIVLMALAAAALAACGSRSTIGTPIAITQSRTSTGYSSIYSFGNGADGAEPKAGLIRVNDALYGTTYAGGNYGDGTVFSITTTGVETVLHSFRGNKDGANPAASLLSVKGVLYGTTEHGGIPMVSDGTVFRISTSGAEKVLHRFRGYYHNGRLYNDGANPVASLVDVNGKLYGTTSGGGSYQFYGTVFSIGASGREKVLYSFTDPAFDGVNPVANLISSKGALYGTTESGGYPYVHGHDGGYGTVVSVSTTGVEKVLYKFGGYGDGAYPVASLTEVNGILYGTTYNGGAASDGTVFSITTGAAEKVIHVFGSGSDGSLPAASLFKMKSTLYGTTSSGGAYGKGTVFSINPTTGTEAVLHSFGYGSDGSTPLAGLIDVNGTLYGTTSAGGAYGNGTFFAVTP